MSEIDPFDELLQLATQGGAEPVQGMESERETLYNFAFIDEDSKREVRRRLLKAVALPCHLVPFASRDLPIARGWGTGGLQVTLALVEPCDVVKVIDQGDDDSVNAVNLRRLIEKTTGIAFTTDTTAASIIKVLPRVPAIDVTAEPLVRRGMLREEARDEAARWLRRLGIEESRWQASPITFSGGEQQRLNLARAFIAAPRLLLLDEPTASLDAVSKAIVLEMISEARAAGVTILTVSHDTAAMQPIADEIFWLNA